MVEIARIRRPLSQTPAARRQRQMRHKRKHGLRAYRLFLPTTNVVNATRARNNLPPGASVTQKQIELTLVDLLDLGMLPWLRLFKKRYR